MNIKKAVGKLSIWGIITAFLLWLANQLLSYLFSLIKPWIDWIISWGLLIIGLLVLVTVTSTSAAIYFAIKAYKNKKKGEIVEEER